MPFKVQINYRYPDEGVVKGKNVRYRSFEQAKTGIHHTLEALKDNHIDKACITIEYIPLKKEG